MLPIIHLSDLHCHLRCPLHHHQVMLWLDLHLGTYQHEPVVCPGNEKDTQSHLTVIHSFVRSLSHAVTDHKGPTYYVPAYAAEGGCPGCDVSCN